MRKFLLENEYGQTISLMARVPVTSPLGNTPMMFGGIMLTSPSGWGFENDYDFNEVDGFYITTKKKTRQVPKPCTLVFMPPNAYSNFKQFVDFVMSAKKLTLMYNPAGVWYYVDVVISRINKGELTGTRCLECETVFLPTTPIYSLSTERLHIEPAGAEDGKKYEYTYPYRYVDNAIASEVVIEPQGQLPGGFQIIMPGPISAPVITFTDLATNQQIGRLDLSAASIVAGQKIRYSNIPTEAGVVTIESDGSEVDMSSLIGLNAALPTFFMLPLDRVRAHLDATSMETAEAELRLYRYYKAV